MNLAYKVALLLRTSYGANNVTNGTFDTDTTGWSAINTPATFESSGGRAHVIANGNGKGFGQSITLVLGATYRVDYDYEVITGTGFTVSKVGMTSQSAQTGSGHKTFTFTESDGTARNLLFQTAGVGDHEFYIDNIQIRRIL